MVAIADPMDEVPAPGAPDMRGRGLEERLGDLGAPARAVHDERDLDVRRRHPVDDVDEAVVRQSSEEQALRLLAETLGAEKIE